MPRARILILAILYLAPVAVLTGVGAYHLWATGWGFYAWWPMAAFLATGYYLTYRWTRQGRYLLPNTGANQPGYWTDRDKSAWQKVDAKARSFDAITPLMLSDPEHYSQLSISLAQQVSQLYNPGNTNPFGHLTVPEILACVELAAAELNEMVEKYVPGSHMFRVDDFKKAQKAFDWYQKGRNAYWLAAAVLNPINTGLQYAATRFGLGSMLERVQGNVLLWFHTAYIHEFGRYLIELNSGRLKVGVKRYRELLAAHVEPPAVVTPPVAEGVTVANGAGVLITSPPVPPPPAPVLPGVTVAVLGQVKAGKSSVVNALLGEAHATVDTLPVEHNGTKYRLGLVGGGAVELLDTRGYGQDGPNEEEFAAAVDAARQADLILLVVPARNPARKPDMDLLDRLKSWFDARPALRFPPVVIAVNQVDQLTPASEWAPPYDWRAGTRPKEANIRDCLLAVRETFAGRMSGVVPVCARTGEVFGIAEELAPALASQFRDARGTSLLKVFHAEGAADRYARLGDQVLKGGVQALKILWDNWKK